jgi:hypothetical protein
VKDKLTFGAGAMISVIRKNDVANSHNYNPPSPFFYGVLTYGDRANNFSLGFGHLNISGYPSSSKYFHISGIVRITNFTSAIFEANQSIQKFYSQSFIHLGCKTVVGKFALNYGFHFDGYSNPYIGKWDYMVFPWLGFGFTFGNTKYLKPIKNPSLL